MASTYSANLRLELIGTGEQQGQWGATTNANLGTLLEQAIGGFESITVGGTDVTLTTADGAVDQARNMVLNFTGTPGAARNVICPAAEKIYIVKNATTGGFAVTMKTAAQVTGISIPNGATAVLYVDGTNVNLVSQNPVPITFGGTGSSTAAGAATNLGLGTGDSPQFAGVNVGNASDTTITRSAAGVLAVEGGVIPKENRANTFTSNQTIDGASLLLNSNTDYAPQVSLTHAGATAGSGAYSILNRARGTYGSPTIVSSGDQLGNVLFQGYDGSAYRSAASIEAQVDGTPGASDMPGRLTFKTTPDGATAATERMRIDNAGRVGIGTTNLNQQLQIGNATDQIGLGQSGNVATAYFGTPSNGSGGIFRIRYDRAGGAAYFTSGTVASPVDAVTIASTGDVTIGGTLSAATAAVDTNTTQVATTAYVVGQGYLKSSTAASTYLTSATAASTYLTSATAASTYLTSATAASTYLTSATAASTYLPIAGTATQAAKLSTTAGSWLGAQDSVVGMLGWKAFGNSHVIFDASAGTAPDGTSVNNTNSVTAWTTGYPTLMGWNGSSTYGVRVDVARQADTIPTSAALNATAGATAGGVGTYALMAWVGLGATQNEGATVAGSSLNFTSVGGGTGGTAGAGTWRLMGRVTTGNPASVFLRIS